MTPRTIGLVGGCSLTLVVMACADPDPPRNEGALLDGGTVELWEAAGDWGVILDVQLAPDGYYFLGSFPPHVHRITMSGDRRSTGAAGDGPAEFRIPVALHVKRGQVGVSDVGHGRTSWLDSAGIVSTNERYAPPRGRLDLATVVHGDPLRRRLTDLGWASAHFPDGANGPSDYWTTSVQVVSGDSTLLAFDFSNLERLDGGSIFPSLPLWDACWDGSLLVLDPAARRVLRVLPDGTSTSLPTPSVPDHRASNESIEDFLLLMADLEGVTGVDEETLRTRVRSMVPRARSEIRGELPIATDIICGGVPDDIWLRGFDSSSGASLGKSQTWHLHRAGEWILVRFPEQFIPLRFFEGEAVGYEVDSLGVQQPARLAF